MPSFGDIDPDFVRGLRKRALISPRSAKRSGLGTALSGSAESSEGGVDYSDNSYEGVAGQAEANASPARRGRFTRADETRLMRAEFGQDREDLAAANEAGVEVERRFNAYQRHPGDYARTSADGQRLRAGDGGRTDHGSISPTHIDDKAHQAGGRVSKSGGAGREQSPAPATAIDAARNARQFPARMAQRADTSHWLNAYRSDPSPRGTEHYRSRDGSYGTLMGDPGWRQE